MILNFNLIPDDIVPSQVKRINELKSFENDKNNTFEFVNMTENGNLVFKFFETILCFDNKICNFRNEFEYIITRRGKNELIKI
jgi:hypothetical protein